MQSVLYSIKMRAAQGGAHEQGGKHISGAERIVSSQELFPALEQLVQRAQQHERGNPDFINISLALISERDIKKISSLPVYSIMNREKAKNHNVAREVLGRTGIKPEVVEVALHYLSHGLAEEGRNMRGAMVIDINSGQRLEPDLSRGVRVTGMDYAPEIKPALAEQLDQFGINNAHAREALCLASKVASVEGIVAELCWSDDPSYTTGYVAAAQMGYIRLEHMKQLGSEQGGRVFFIDPGIARAEKVIAELENQPCLINRLGPVYPPISWDDFIRQVLRKE